MDNTYRGIRGLKQVAQKSTPTFIAGGLFLAGVLAFNVDPRGSTRQTIDVIATGHVDLDSLFADTVQYYDGAKTQTMYNASGSTIRPGPADVTIKRPILGKPVVIKYHQ